MRISDWSSDVCSSDLQARDVVARLIYGFRISVVFGLVLAACSAVIGVAAGAVQGYFGGWTDLLFQRSEEHTSELQSLMRISYAVFCLTKKKLHKHKEYITCIANNQYCSNNYTIQLDHQYQTE